MPTDATNKEGQNKNRYKRLRMYIGLAVSFLCLWWVFRSVEQEKIVQKFSEVEPAWLLIAVFATFTSYLLRSVRWPIFFEKNPPSLKTSFIVLIIGFFMNNILPARIGELVRAHLGGRETKQSRSTVLATIAGERLADGLMISLLFALLFPLFPVPLQSTNGLGEMYIVAYLFLAVAVGTVVTLIFRQKIFSFLEYLQQVMPGHLSRYTLVRVRYFIEGLAPLLKPRKVMMLSLLSIVVWSVELFVYYCVSRAFAHPLSLGGLSLFLAAVNFSSLIPAAPAGAGVIEMFGTLALERIGIDRESALAMVATQHLIQIAVVGIPGSVLFFSRLGGKVPEPEDDADEAIDYQSEEPFQDISQPRPQAEEQTDSVEGVPLSLQQQELLDLSIVVPAFNEEQRLPRALLEILEYFKHRPSLRYEVLVVDDGSSDATGKVVQHFAEISPKFKLLTYPKNRGKGFAVRFGVINSRGARILFADADGATPIEEIARLEAALDQGAQIAIGSRALYSRDTAVSTVWYRKYIGRVFNGIVNVLLLPGIADTQCGFKMFTREVAFPIFRTQRAERFSFDAEVLFLARKGGCRIAEVPINWTNIPGSKVNLMQDSFLMFRDLLKFRLRDIFGGYDSLQLHEDLDLHELDSHRKPPS
jgi:dolichyl-phosphate beta-glucosyltransferase